LSASGIWKNEQSTQHHGAGQCSCIGCIGLRPALNIGLWRSLL